MTKITKKFNYKYPHFIKRKQIKRKQKYFLIISRKISKHGSDLKSNCVLMKSTSNKKLQALKLVEINRSLLKKYSKQSFLYPTRKKIKHPWELEIPLALLKEVTKIINDEPKRVVIHKKTEPDNTDDGEEIQEYDEDSVDTNNMIIHISSSSSECTSPERFIDDNEYSDKFSGFVSHTKYYNDQKELECQYCSKKFKQQRSLDVHMKRLHQEIEIQNKQPCPQCDKLFKCKDTLNEHLKIHDVSKFLHKCLECDKTFKNSVFLSRHKETHLNEPIKTKNLLNSEQSKYFIALNSKSNF